MRKGRNSVEGVGTNGPESSTMGANSTEGMRSKKNSLQAPMDIQKTNNAVLIYRNPVPKRQNISHFQQKLNKSTSSKRIKSLAPRSLSKARIAIAMSKDN